MTKKTLAQRRQRNRELAAIDAANRCAYCRKAVVPMPVGVSTDDGRLLCSVDCLLALMDREAAEGR